MLGLQQHDGDFPVSSSLSIRFVTRIIRNGQIPIVRTLIAICLAGEVRARTPFFLDYTFRVGSKVIVPGRVAFASKI